MIVVPLKGKIMFKVIKKVVKLCVKLEYICNVVIADLFSKHSFSKLLSLFNISFRPNNSLSHQQGNNSMESALVVSAFYADNNYYISRLRHMFYPIPHFHIY